MSKKQQQPDSTCNCLARHDEQAHNILLLPLLLLLPSGNNVAWSAFSQPLDSAPSLHTCL
jgi:hypothetical protein